MTRGLTDRTLKTLKPAPAGSRYDVRDGQTPGLVVRVSDTGSRTFALQARFPAARARRGEPWASIRILTLEAARDKARTWRRMIREGEDPAQAEADARRDAQRHAENTFGTVAEAFIVHIRAQGQRRAAAVEREIRRELMPAWREKPIAGIKRDDVVKLVKALAAGALTCAHGVRRGPVDFQLRDCAGCLRDRGLALRSVAADADHPAQEGAPARPERRGTPCVVAGHRTTRQPLG